jgi:hypothetical protein
VLALGLDDRVGLLLYAAHGAGVGKPALAGHGPPDTATRRAASRRGRARALLLLPMVGMLVLLLLVAMARLEERDSIVHILR